MDEHHGATPCHVSGVAPLGQAEQGHLGAVCGRTLEQVVAPCAVGTPAPAALAPGQLQDERVAERVQVPDPGEVLSHLGPLLQPQVLEMPAALLPGQVVLRDDHAVRRHGVGRERVGAHPTRQAKVGGLAELAHVLDLRVLGRVTGQGLVVGDAQEKRGHAQVGVHAPVDGVGHVAVAEPVHAGLGQGTQLQIGIVSAHEHHAGVGDEALAQATTTVQVLGVGPVGAGPACLHQAVVPVVDGRGLPLLQVRPPHGQQLGGAGLVGVGHQVGVPRLAQGLGGRADGPAGRRRSRGALGLVAGKASALELGHVAGQLGGGLGPRPAHQAHGLQLGGQGILVSPQGIQERGHQGRVRPQAPAGHKVKGPRTPDLLALVRDEVAVPQGHILVAQGHGSLGLPDLPGQPGVVQGIGQGLVGPRGQGHAVQLRVSHTPGVLPLGHVKAQVPAGAGGQGERGAGLLHPVIGQPALGQHQQLLPHLGV